MRPFQTLAFFGLLCLGATPCQGNDVKDKKALEGR